MAYIKKKPNLAASVRTPGRADGPLPQEDSPAALPQDDVAAFRGRAGQRRADGLGALRTRYMAPAARIADDNRAKDILLLDLRQATPLIDFFVIASANSRRQAYAIASEIDQELKKLGEAKLGMEGAEEGRWILVDYGDFVVHIFSEDARTYYALEEIWGDAPRASNVCEPRPDSRHVPYPSPGRRTSSRNLSFRADRKPNEVPY